MTGNPLRYIAAESTVPPDFTEEELSRLDHINRRIAAGETLRDILNFHFEAVQPLIPCDRLAVAFVEEGGDRMVLYHAVTAYDDVRLGEGFSDDITTSSLATVFRSGMPRIIDDLAAYAQEHPNSRSTRLLVEEGIRSSMTCPLQVDGRPVGVLFFSSRTPGAYGERQIMLHRIIVERLSQAVEKAWRIEQLQNALAAYHEMLAFVTHELKSPLDSIMTLGNTLKKGYFGPLGDKQTETVERMVGQAARLSDLVKEYLNLARFESGQAALASAPIADFAAEVLEPVLAVIEPQLRDRRIDVTRDLPASPIALTADKNLLSIVMANYCSNAVKYGNEGGAMKIRAWTEDASLRVTVWNEGPGFPAAQRGRLFRRFSRLESEELLKRKGSGIGLYNCWKIVRLHGGRVWAESQEGAWAEFGFEVPLTASAAK